MDEAVVAMAHDNPSEGLLSLAASEFSDSAIGVHLGHDRLVVQRREEDVAIPYRDLALSSGYIAKGSFGRVYAGLWRGRRVAVKIFQTSLADDREQVEGEFNRERGALLSVRTTRGNVHPAVVQYLGYSVCLDRLAIVMPLAEHGSLKTVLTSTRKLYGCLLYTSPSPRD